MAKSQLNACYPAGGITPLPAEPGAWSSSPNQRGSCSSHLGRHDSVRNDTPTKQPGLNRRTTYHLE
jgi:hypothetical protein